MSEKKQTAVEWLEKIINHCQKYNRHIEQKDINQAKAMEKEQIRFAMSEQAEKYTGAYIDEDRNPRVSFDIDDSFNDHFKETYENE